jgi:hypothetical protein
MREQCKRLWCSLGSGVLLILVCIGPALAQTGQIYGEITGKVVDAQGRVLPGVTVSLTGAAIMGVQSNVTSDQGVYRFPFLPSGTYGLRFELQGFRGVVLEGLIVTARTTVTQDATLEVAAFEETVTVVGDSPVVDVTNTKMGSRLESDLLAAVPTARSLFGAVSQLPGVVMGRQDIGGLNSFQPPSVIAHGQSAYQITLGGTRAEGVTQNGSYYYTDFNMMEEVSVETAGMGAEVGPAGAMVNIIPKSGGNDFKGTAYITGTGKDLAADNVSGDSRLEQLGVSDPPLPLRMYDYNVDAGGRLKRDRVWWYTSWRDYNYYERIVGFPIDSQARLTNFIFRPTVQVTQNNKLSGMSTFSGKRQPYRDGSFTTPPESTHDYYQPIYVHSVNWTSVLGKQTFLEVVSGHYYLNIQRNSSHEFEANPQSPTVDLARGLRSGQHSGGAAYEIPNTFTNSVALTRYKDNWLGATHQMKAGFQHDYGFASREDLPYGDVEYRYSNGVPTEIFAYNSPVKAEYAAVNVAGFVQDRITFPRASLNLGVRYSYANGWFPEQTGGGGGTLGSPSAGWVPRTVFPKLETPFRWSNISPRIGIAATLTEDNRNVVKASYGRYYDILTSGDFSLINPNTFNNIATYRWFGDLNNNGVVDSNEYNPAPLSVFVARSNSIDPDFKQPKVDEITLAYERQLLANVGFTASWVQRWFTDNWADVNIGIPLTGYTPATFPDAGPDNIVGTGDDRTITMFNVLPGFRGKQAYRRQTVEGTKEYKALELSVTKRMMNNWQLTGSYVWSRDDGVILSGNRKSMADPNDPNASLDSHKYGRSNSDLPHAFKLLFNWAAPLGINLGANYQALSGVPLDRTYRRSLAQGSVTVRADKRGTYSQDSMQLLALKVDRPFRFGRARLGAFVELHNLLNSNAGISYGTLTQSYASQAALDAANRTNTAYFGRPTVILTPRIIKLGAKLEF